MHLMQSLLDLLGVFAFASSGGTRGVFLNRSSAEPRFPDGLSVLFREAYAMTPNTGRGQFKGREKIRAWRIRSSPV